MRTLYNATDVTKSTKPFRTVIIFRTQQLLDLWFNEMQKQILDGMWENSHHIAWLWRDAACILGDKTEVLVEDSHRIYRKAYPLTVELWECVGDKILDENGFATKEEAYAAWKEIAVAIQHMRVMTDKEKQLYIINCKLRHDQIRDTLILRWNEVKNKIEKHYKDEIKEATWINTLRIKIGVGKWVEITPKYNISCQSLKFKVGALQVKTVEQVYKAVELFRDFHTRAAELTK